LRLPARENENENEDYEERSEETAETDRTKQIVNGKHSVCLCFQLLEVVLYFATSWHGHQVKIRTKRKRKEQRER